MENCQEISYKIFFQNEVRRVTQEQNKQQTFSQFLSFVESLFCIEKIDSSLQLQYEDEEGDKITVSSEPEWREACRVLRDQTPRKFYFVEKPSLSSLVSEFKRNATWRRNDPTSAFEDREIASKGRKSMEKQAATPAHALLSAGQSVHLRSKVSGKTLRILRDGSVDGRGGQGQWAKFQVHQGLLSTETIRLQSVADSKHWLRISPDSKTLDGLGRGGPFTEFFVTVNQDEQQQQTVLLRSLKNSSAGVGVTEQGLIKVPTSCDVQDSFVVSVASPEPRPARKK